MNRGEFLTRLTIWLALCAYGSGASLMLVHHRDRADRMPWARWVWTAGCGFFAAHVACAFGYYHHWSHAAAYLETASRTGAITGWRWGGGIYFNYVFAAAWVADVLWWWSAPESFARRPALITGAWHGFFFFMVFNGTIVFGKGPVRWLGGLICGGLAVLWWWKRRSEIAAGQPIG